MSTSHSEPDRKEMVYEEAPKSTLCQWHSQSSAITGALGGCDHVLSKVNFDPSFEIASLTPGAHICC